MTQYHILNGDALKAEFPSDIDGEIIVARECFVDGDVQGDSLEELFETRAHFMLQYYEGFTQDDYHPKVVLEFEKISAIPQDAEVNLWFEDDLFCQVNLWFVLHLLNGYGKTNSIYLVRSKSTIEFGFAGMDGAELRATYHNKVAITPSESLQLSQLWKLYQQNAQKEMLIIAENLSLKYPFLMPAIEAQAARSPKDGKPGRPTQSLIDIMQELQTTEFAPVFKVFCQRESIYGFGDLQVKRLMERL